MTLAELFKQLNIPPEIQRNIHEFNKEKKEFDHVLNQLSLYYNSGLWWLYKSHVNTLSYMNDQNGEFYYDEAIDPEYGKVEFITYDDSMDIVEQAFNLEEVNDEFKTKIYHKAIKKYT